MNFGAFVSPPRRRNPQQQQTRYRSETELPMKGISMKTLSECPRQALPLHVRVSTDSSIVDSHAVYRVVVHSVTSNTSWSVAYRYSEFRAFKSTVEEVLTCGSTKCSGSCQAIRDYIHACFPKKRVLFSTSPRVVRERASKLENVLLHLLRCVLLPGSAMKCADARRSLPLHLFEFLGVADAQDRRSLLQIYVDNYQAARSLERASFASTSTACSEDWHASDLGHGDSQCVICLEDVELSTHEHSRCSSACSHAHGDNSDDEDDETTTECATEDSLVSSATDAATADHDAAGVELPCGHVFHRACVFEWLLFQFHCPLCRSRVGPPAVTNYCRAKNRVQWWLGEFEEDPLRAA